MELRYRFRLYLLTALILIGFGVLLTRLYDFQIQRRDQFQQMMPGVRIVTVREPGIRGEITDRNGIPLARNLRNYEVSFNLEEIYNAYRVQHVEPDKTQRIVKEDGLSRKRSEKDIVKIVNESTLKRLDEKDLKLAKNYNAKALRTHFLTHAGLVPFSYRTDLSYEEFARLAERNLDLPGVMLGTRPHREYPYGTLASHILGYVKQWEKGDVPDSAVRKFNHYIGEEKGLAGVEATMDAVLRGPEGTKEILKDEKGAVVKVWDNVLPGVGAKVELTIDARIQYLLENTLRRAGRAAGVVMDVNTGEVIAMASVPDFDPNAFIPSISAKQWEAYKGNATLAPLNNRAIMSFAPGSTFKIPTAIAGAMEGMAEKSYACNGYVTYGNKNVGCWLWNKSRGRHGMLTLPKAIQQSCNPYFNTLANTIGWRAMVDGFTLVGFGKTTGIELPAEDPGIVPGSRRWRDNNPNAQMTLALTAFLSIGQGDAMATPLQLCAMTACVANGGKYYQPRVVKKAEAADRSIVIADTPKLEVDIIEAGVKPSDLELIRKGMWMAVNQPGGTAGRVKLPNVEVAAKTGTAQTSDNGKPSHNSWVISFAPFDKPKYAVCVLVQNGKSGGAVCGPLVNLIYRGLFARDEGMKLPLQRQTEFIGNTDPIEEIKLPEDVLAAINATEGADDGETGEEAGTIVPDLPVAPPVAQPVLVTPTPTITDEVDSEGTVIPRAVPVPEE